MMTDPYTAASTIAGVLIAGVITGAILAGLAARSRHLDDEERAGRAFRELRDLAVACADPVHQARLMRGAARIWDDFRPDGLALDVKRPAPPTAEYVHRLIDAYATSAPINFSGCWVPPDVQGRLRAILASSARSAITPRLATGGPIHRGAKTLLSPDDLPLITPRTSDG